MLSAQNDSLPTTRMNGTGIVAWQYDNFLKKDTVIIDTAVNDFQIYNPVYRKNFLITGTTGNLASPSYNLFLSPPEKSSFFNASFYNYLTDDRAVRFYNTKNFYTNIFYFTNGSKNINLQSISVLHTQNIKPFWNFAIDYRLYASNGIYANQKSKFASFVFSSTYERHRYKSFFIIKNQQFKIGENGGIVDENDIEVALAPVNIPVQLSEASNKLRNFNVNLTQVVPLIAWYNNKLSISHSFVYDRKKHFYSDVPSAYYASILYDSLQTLDSTRIHALKNILKLNLSALHTSWYLGYGNNLVAYFSNVDSTDFVENFIIAGSRFHDKKLKAELNLKHTFSGFYQGNFSANGEVKYALTQLNDNDISMAVHFYNRRPDYFYWHFTANNFYWDTILNKEQIFSLHSFLNLWSNRLVLGINYYRWLHYGYFDSLFVYRQLPTEMNHFTLSGELKVPLKHFYFHTHVLYQRNSQSAIIDFPDFVAMQSLNCQSWFFKKALFAQVGVSVNYFSSFYGRGYIPALLHFYAQQTDKIGNYPFIDAYINLKIKRARFFFKLEHLNSGMSGANYFTAIHYPLQQRAFRFGISWSFYD